MAEIPTLTDAPVAAIEQARRPRSRLATNSFAMGVANVSGRGISYFGVILMARRLDTRYLGAYALLLTANMLLELVSNLGLDKILTREIASNPPEVGQGYFKRALPIRLTMATLSYAAAWALLYLFFKHQLLAGPLAVALFLAVIFPVVVTRNCEAYLTAHEHLVPIAASQLLERILVFGAVLLLVSGHIQFGGLLCLAPLASCARFLVVAFSVARLWLSGLVTQSPNLQRLLRQGAELFSVEILALVYFRSDVFFLAKIRGLGDAGIYQIAYKIFDFCLSLFTGFLQAVFPRMVRDNSRKSLKVILGVGTGLLAVPAGIIIALRNVIMGGFGGPYRTGATALVWLMLTVPLVYINSTLVNSVIAAGRVKILIVLAVSLVVSNVGLNLLLIPHWSLNGAAFSTFACELLSTLLLGPFMIKMLARDAA